MDQKSADPVGKILALIVRTDTSPIISVTGNLPPMAKRKCISAVFYFIGDGPLCDGL